mmetsp:Transcript_12100/g.28068  ORF Transcript_12100/g.28068 Transcript_12100/m.28068 type:complete len:217 (-) Transcript_12100:78-728(-)
MTMHSSTLLSVVALRVCFAAGLVDEPLSPIPTGLRTCSVECVHCPSLDVEGWHRSCSCLDAQLHLPRVLGQPLEDLDRRRPTPFLDTCLVDAARGRRAVPQLLGHHRLQVISTRVHLEEAVAARTTIPLLLSRALALGNQRVPVGNNRAPELNEFVVRLTKPRDKVAVGQENAVPEALAIDADHAVNTHRHRRLRLCPGNSVASAGALLVHRHLPP